MTLLSASDLSTSRSQPTDSTTTVQIDQDKIPQKTPSSKLKTTTSQDISQNMQVQYEEKISDDIYIKQENNWANPSSPISDSGLENRNIRKFKNSNIWSADWKLLDKLHLGSSATLDKQFQQGDALKQYQLGKDISLKWTPTSSTEIKSGEYIYSMFGEDWGTSDNKQYYIQTRQKLGSTPMTLQLKPAVFSETIRNTDNSYTLKDGQQIDSSVDWRLNSEMTWTLGNQFRNTSYKNSVETEFQRNIYSRWNITPSSMYNFNISTSLERYRKDDFDNTSNITSTSDKLTFQLGQKLNINDDLCASFDIWQSTITHATSDIERTQEHAATISLQKKF